LVDRYAPSIQIAERIKGNPVFRSGIASMSGIEEYIALGRVFELYQDEQFDELIIDSAPTRYAINFFKTPDKLLNVLNPENIQQILKSLHRYKNDGIKPNFKNSNPLIRKTFEMLGGKLLIQNFADFADDLKHFFDKFRCRVHQINSILRNTDMTTILLITRPDYRAFEESKKIFDDLTTSNLTIKHVIINQVTRSFFPEKIEKEILHYFQQHLAFNNFETAKRRVIRQIKTDRRIHNSEIDIIRNYINLLKSDAKFIQIPRFAQTSNAVELLTAFFKYLEDPVFARWQSNGDIGR